MHEYKRMCIKDKKTHQPWEALQAEEDEGQCLELVPGRVRCLTAPSGLTLPLGLVNPVLEVLLVLALAQPSDEGIIRKRNEVLRDRLLEAFLAADLGHLCTVRESFKAELVIYSPNPSREQGDHRRKK